MTPDALPRARQILTAARRANREDRAVDTEDLLAELAVLLDEIGD